MLSMPRIIGDRSDKESLSALASEYIEWLLVTNYSTETARLRVTLLNSFLRWCFDRDITRPSQVTRPILERYKRALYYGDSQKTGKPLTFYAQHNRLMAVRSFFRWLSRNNYVLANPAAELDPPRREKRLPRNIPSLAQVEHVLRQPDIGAPVGLRDRAILETFFSTGVRRFELVGVKLYDLDREEGVLFIREGKGKKDRVIPIGERALAWVEKYIIEVRPRFVTEPDEGWLFLTTLGTPLSLTNISHTVRGYIVAAGLDKRGSCHMFRHAMATAMLEGGADIRYIQQMLGHANLNTTQIYTQVSIAKLKEVHAKTHPARLLHDRENAAPDAHGSATTQGPTTVGTVQGEILTP